MGGWAHLIFSCCALKRTATTAVIRREGSSAQHKNDLNRDLSQTGSLSKASQKMSVSNDVTA